MRTFLTTSLTSPHGDEGEQHRDRHRPQAGVLGGLEIEGEDGVHGNQIRCAGYPESRMADERPITMSPVACRRRCCRRQIRSPRLASPKQSAAEPPDAARCHRRRGRRLSTLDRRPGQPSAMPAATRSSATPPTGSATTAGSTPCGPTVGAGRDTCVGPNRRTSGSCAACAVCKRWLRRSARPTRPSAASSSSSSSIPPVRQPDDGDRRAPVAPCSAVVEASGSAATRR